MTRQICTAVCTAIVALATAGIGAQTTSSSQKDTSGADKHVTVTGCLKEAPANADGTAAPGDAPAGAPGAAGSGRAGAPGPAGDATTAGQRFQLTNAVSAPAPADPAGAANAPGPGASAPHASGTETYPLIANPSALSPHIGKKLELVGTLEKESATRTTAPASGSDPDALSLRVESGKVVAPTCP
jgi:hypothetical protein